MKSFKRIIAAGMLAALTLTAALPASAATNNMGGFFADKAKWKAFDGESDTAINWTADGGISVNARKKDVRICYTDPSAKIPDGDSFSFKLKVEKNPQWLCVLFRNGSPEAGIWMADQSCYGIQISTEAGIAIVKWPKGGEYQNLTPNDEAMDNVFLDKKEHLVDITTQNVNGNKGVKITIKIDGKVVKEITDSDKPILEPGYVTFHGLHDVTTLAPLTFTVWPAGKAEPTKNDPTKTDTVKPTTTGAKSTGTVAGSTGKASSETTAEVSDSSAEATTGATRDDATTANAGVTSGTASSTGSTVPTGGSDGGFPWGVVIAAGCVVVLGGGGAAVYFLVIRPKRMKG